MKRFSLTRLTTRWPDIKSNSGATIKKSEIKRETFPKVKMEAIAMIGIQSGDALLLPNPTSCHGAK